MLRTMRTRLKPLHGRSAAASIGRGSSVLVASALIAGLPFGAPALAAKAKGHSKAKAHRHKPKTSKGEAVHLGAHHWKIGVDGKSYAVRAGGELTYASCSTVETISPVVRLSGKPGRYKAYTGWLVGPKRAGVSTHTERGFETASTVAEFPIPPAAFPNLTRAVNEAPYVPGTYTLKMKLGGVLSKPTTVETIKLVVKGTC